MPEVEEGIQTPEQEQILQEQENETKRFLELTKKAERTEDEDRELEEIRTNYGQKVQKTVGKYYSRSKIAEARAREAEERAIRLEQQLEEAKKTPAQTSEPVVVTKETIKVGDKSFYTDKALSSMVKAGQMTEEDAWAHQQERIEERAVTRAYERLNQDRTKSEEESIRNQDAKEALNRYPHFSRSHPDFNPNDPLYVAAMEYYEDGFKYNPRGLTKSLDLAEKALGVKKQIKDRSEEFNVRTPNYPVKKVEVETIKDIELSEYEKETAIKQWTRGDIINPKTGRIYTENEAIEKGKKAKLAIMQRRAAR